MRTTKAQGTMVIDILAVHYGNFVNIGQACGIRPQHWNLSEKPLELLVVIPIELRFSAKAQALVI
jgi:hypothetical protein